MKKKGFTLIELLAVIVILAIIALIVTPIVSKLIDSAKKSANARSVEGHIKNIEYAVIQAAFSNSMEDLKKYDGVTSDTIFRATATIQDGDDIYCESITLSDGLVTIASGCRKTGWDKEYTYERGIGAYVTGTARPIVNSGSSNPEPSTPEPTEPEIDLTVGLFDENDNLLVSWHDLVNTYGLDIEKDYTDPTSDPTSCYSVMYKNHFTGKLVMPNTVTKIGNDAFWNCDITGITIPNSVTSIGSSAFYNSNITSIEVPSSVIEIKSSAFRGMQSLTSVILPNNITSLSDYLFYNSKKLSSVIVSNNLETIGNETFYGTESLTSITLPSSVSLINERAFQNSGLTSFVVPSNVSKILSNTFYNSKNLASITLPEGLEEIYASAFYGCSSLTSITIPSTVSWIGPNSFKNSGLTSATFTSSSGWYAADQKSSKTGTNLDLSNPSTNATYLTATYVGKHFKKSN